MAQQWRSINDLYHVKGGTKEKEPEPVDIYEGEEQRQEEGIEVKLSDPVFIEPEEGFQANKPCKMKVSVELVKETKRKKVSFDVYSAYKNKDKEVKEYSGLEGYITDGIAVAEMKYLPLNEDYSRDTNKTADAMYTIRFTASHPNGDKVAESKKLEMPSQDQNIGPEDIICYCASKEQYFVVPVDNTDVLMQEIDGINTLGRQIYEYQETIKSSQNNKKNYEKAAALEQAIEKKFKGLKTRPGEAIEEMLAVRTNKRWGDMSRKIYICSYARKNGAVKGHWCSDSDSSVKKQLKRYLKEDASDDNGKGMDKKFKATFFESEKLDEQWPLKWKFGEPDKDYLENSDHFSCKAEAQFCRFVAGATAGTELDWENKKFELGGKASVSYGILDGSASFSYYFPNKDGGDIFGGINSNPKFDALIKGKKELRVRVMIRSDGHVFAGASVTAAARVPYIDFSDSTEDKSKKKNTDKKNAVDGEVELAAFGGASAEGKLTGSGEWSRSAAEKFDSLGQLYIGGALRAGLGAELKVKIGYIQGKIRFQFAISLVFGPGAKGSYGWEVDLKEGYELVTYLLESVDYHFALEIGTDTYEKLCDFGSAVYTEIVDGIEEKIKAGWRFLTMRDSEQVRGYRLRVKVPVRESLKEDSPQAPFDLQLPHSIADILRCIMRTAEVEDFDVILETLRKIKTQHKLKSVLRALGERSLNERREKTGPGKPGWEAYQKASGNALKEGIRILMEHGGDFERDEDKDDYSKYKENLRKLLAIDKGITIE